ncbi:YfaP family protein [Aeromonas cavernicola]|uniref:DUF2135 domain-containing protein n=1 Tax=Aeromonas cavernicola TaxID=1006623 RepID=A0A2H9U0C9_9GAMM|nr:DUF2135 domain-containing protein [Aeromonas cavernicola]PJG57505.1 hypothetical protein CUC53_17685 [Aeromonas cavernicola]
MTIYPRFCRLLVLGLLPWAGQVGAASIELDTPVGGWRQGEGKGSQFQQTVNYPAASVNVREGQSNSALIKGRIAQTTKPGEQQPARLVVNGLAMPLRVNDDGSFARPYAFPAGSNSVEVISPDGQQRKRVQFLHRGGSNGEVAAKLRVMLSWDSDNTDLDLHLVTPDGGHLFYGNRSLPNGMAQDVDVTTGYGPEIMATPTPLNGPYLVYVNYYGGGWDRAPEDPLLTTAQVTIISEEGSVHEKQETFVIPMRNPGELTFVKRFDYTSNHYQ